jgi:hypothetical protein
MSREQNANRHREIRKANENKVPSYAGLLDLFQEIGAPYFIASKVKLKVGDIILDPETSPLYVVRECTEQEAEQSIISRLNMDNWKIELHPDCRYFYEVTTD